MALQVLGAATIVATSTGKKTPKEITKKGTKINKSLSGATDLTTQTNMLHTNDEMNVNDDNDELFDTLDTDNDSKIEDTDAASKAKNDDSVSAFSGDTAFYDLMKEGSKVAVLSNNGSCKSYYC